MDIVRDCPQDYRTDPSIENEYRVGHEQNQMHQALDEIASISGEVDRALELAAELSRRTMTLGGIPDV